MILQSQFKLLSSYDHSFIAHATVITITIYDRTVITIIIYDHKTFIVQATGQALKNNVCHFFLVLAEAGFNPSN
jgi:hypothetical protein